MTKSIVVSINTAWNTVNFRAPLIAALIRQGYDLVVAAPPDEYSDRIAQLGCRYVPIAIDNKGTNPFLDFKLLIDFYRLFSEVRPFCFLAYTVKPNVYGSLAARILGIPTINNVTGLGTAFIRPSWITHVTKILQRVAFSKSYRVFFQNGDDLDYFLKLRIVRHEIALRIPGSGVDTTLFSPREVAEDSGRFCFLLIGRLLWDKGIKEYVEAARQIKKRYSNIEFQLLGFLDVANRTAVPRSQIEQWEQEKLITYLGYTDNVIPFIQRVDCVVLPSYREGAPRALLEAASMAKPIITTDAPGCRDVVDDCISGFLVKIGDASDLAEKMEKMLLLPKNRRDFMGKSGRDKVVREFDENIVINEYLTAIKALSQGTGKSR